MVQACSHPNALRTCRVKPFNTRVLSWVAEDLRPVDRPICREETDGHCGGHGVLFLTTLVFSGSRRNGYGVRIDASELFKSERHFSVAMGIFERLKGEEPWFFQKLPHLVQGKGHFGEYLTEYALKNGDLGNVAVFSNVLVPRSYGAVSASEIDVIMLTNKKIYVIESKNYSGWIFGNAEQQDWTVIYSAKTRGKLFNPIIQNRSHVKALSDCIGLEPWYFKSYIVFSDKCTLKSVPPNTSEYAICKKNQLLDSLRKDLNGREQVFHAAKFAQIKHILSKLKSESTDEKRLQQREEARKVASGLICPVCGSPLVRRNGKYGAFLGCSRYPNCTFTRNI